MAKRKGTEIRKEEIISAAMTLVAQHGVRSMTIERVANIVGIVPSAIYRHFKNKAEIIEAVFNMIVEQMKDNVKEVIKENNNSLEAIKSLLMRQVKLVTDFIALPQILFSEEVYSENFELKSKLHSLIKDFLDTLTELIKKGQRRGEIRTDIHPLRIATMFLGLFQPSAFLYHLSGGTFDVVKQIDTTWKVFRKAIQNK